MITNTTLSALRALLHLGHHSPTLIPPRRIAEELGESPTYMSKVTTQLVKAGVLRAERGAKGGVQLAKPPGEITLLDVVRACQGEIVGGYCRSVCEPELVCAFHSAAEQLERAIVESLERWTLRDLLERPRAAGEVELAFPCAMVGPAQVGVRKPADGS